MQGLFRKHTRAHLLELCVDHSALIEIVDLLQEDLMEGHALLDRVFGPLAPSTGIAVALILLHLVGGAIVAAA